MTEEIDQASLPVLIQVVKTFPGSVIKFKKGTVANIDGNIVITTPDREAASAEFVDEFKNAGLTGIWRVNHAKQQTSQNRRNIRTITREKTEIQPHPR